MKTLRQAITEFDEIHADELFNSAVIILQTTYRK
jgi:hypothetical protein